MGVCAGAGGRRGLVGRHFRRDMMVSNDDSDARWACIALDSAIPYLEFVEHVRNRKCDRKSRVRDTGSTQQDQWSTWRT